MQQIVKLLRSVLLIYSNRVILHQEFVFDFALRRKGRLSVYILMDYY